MTAADVRPQRAGKLAVVVLAGVLCSLLVWRVNRELSACRHHRLRAVRSRIEADSADRP